MQNKILHISLLLFLSLVARAQIKIENLALVDPDTNFLYIGIENKVRISGVKDNSSIRVKMDGRFYSAEKNGLFYVKAAGRGKTELHVYLNSKIIASKSYNIDRIPEPIVLLGPYRDTAISKTELLNYDRLRVVFPNCFYRHLTPVVQFDLTIISKNKELNRSDKVYGNTIPAFYKIMIKILESGDKIVFENIRVSGPDDLRVEPFYILLK